MLIDWAILKKHDPDLVNLRKAARTVLVAPPLFLFFHFYVGNSLLGIFAFLSAFVLLVFANLGGPVRSRIAGYSLLIVLTNGAIALGTALSGTVFAAASAMFAVMFMVTFSTVYGGIAAALVAPVALAFSFSVFLPIEAIDMGHRLFGWSLGGVIAGCAAVLLWPVNIREGLRRDLSETALNFAQTLAEWSEGNAEPAAKERAAHALENARTKAASPLRPASVASRDVGLHHLVDNFNYAQELIGRMLQEPMRPADKAITDVITKALKAAARSIVDRTTTDDFAAMIDTLDRAREARRDEVRRSVKDLMEPNGTDSADALNALRQTFVLLTLSHVGLWILANVAAADDQEDKVHRAYTAPELSGETGAGKTRLQRAGLIAFANLDSEGVIFHNSLRAAIAMTLGVLVAKLAPVDHGFWITLGILSVLRSSASSTSATALHAIFGTFLGFVLAALTILIIGHHPDLYLLLIPPYVFLAAYAPATAGFAIGQAAFTSMVVVVFNFVKPLGFDTDLMRLETVSIGAITATIVALIFWPRGARASIARSVSRVYLAAAEGLKIAMKGSDAERVASDQRLLSAQQRAKAAFTLALGEHGEPIDAAAWGQLSRPPAMIRSILGGLLPALPQRTPDGCQKAATALENRSGELVLCLERIGADLEQSKAGPSIPPSGDPMTSNIADLQHCLASSVTDGRQGIDEALIILAWCDWLSQLEWAVKATGPALGTVAAASAPRAWLHWSPTGRSANASSSATKSSGAQY